MANMSEQVPVMDVADELPAGTKLMSGQYEITGYLNHGGFGITYIAKDSLNRNVVVKECYPSSMCHRSQLSVQPRSRAHIKDLESVIRLFVKEAQALSKVEHPNIVGVHQVFEDHNTAYMVLDYIDGSDLLTYIENPADKLMPALIKTVLGKMLDAVGFVHDAGVLHRDISPDNIILTKSLEPMLIDFGAARQQASKATRALSALRVVKDGYSPQEFYLAGSMQSPASDLYSLAATFYHLITGEIPPDSQMRLTAHVTDDGDPYVPLSQKTDAYDENFCAAIDKALAILPRDRLQTAAEWKAMMTAETPAKRTSKSQKVISKIPSRRLSQHTKRPPVAVKKKKKAPNATRNVSAVAISLAAAGVLIGATLLAPADQADTAMATVQTAVVETPVTTTPVVTADAPQAEETVEIAATASISPASGPSTLPTSWADGQVTLGWTAELPFVLDENGVVQTADASQLPVPIGSRLISINGQDVAGLGAINAAINDAVTASDGKSAQMVLGWAQPESTNTFSTQLPVDVIYKTAFNSGVHFETRYAGETWVTYVTQTPAVQGFPLELGDEIVALVPENRRIIGATSLAEVTSEAWAQDRTELKLAVRRANTLWVADVSVTQKAG